MTIPDLSNLPAAPCIAAFCATCTHAHVGGACSRQVVVEEVRDTRGLVVEQRHGPCGCEKFVREKPTRCAFDCKCDSPKCDCDSVTHCQRHADAILAHRAKPKHKLHDLALSAHHPHD